MPSRPSAPSVACSLRALAVLVGWGLSSALMAQDTALQAVAATPVPVPIPRPVELQPDVDFWIRVYSEISTSEGFLHDEWNLAVVYARLEFPPGIEPALRREAVDAARARYVEALELASAAVAAALPAAPAAESLPADVQRVLSQWGAAGTRERLLEASRGVRFQLGQSDRFKGGIVRSGTWEAHIARTFASLGLPAELAALPHVESSFTPSAYSKVGAAGLWQFMRSTGRMYMRVDDIVDERLDPFRATEAAAQLLSYNYRVLGTWPLALTAYNHGASGKRRARDAMGTDDFVTIARGYRGASFGFASRNFYPSFLAALTIDQNPEKYFGTLERAPELRFQELALPGYARVGVIARAVEVPRATLQELNPALRPAIWDESRLVPRGYRLRLPPSADAWTPERLALAIGEGELYAAQIRPRSHKVGRGETLTTIARRYGVGTREVAELNGLTTTSKLRRGSTLRLPDARPPLMAGPSPGATRSPTAAPAPVMPSAVIAGAVGAVGADAAAAPPSIYVVRAGDSLFGIAARFGLSAEELMRVNRLRDPDFIFEGQRLRVSRDVATLAAAEEPSAPPVTVVPRAAPEAAEAVAPAGTVDTLELAVASDDTIRVIAEETLGHLADWLGVGASRLRELNRMRQGQPVLLGRTLKLDFSRVTREQFEQRRRDFHTRLQAGFFAQRRIVGTEVYIVRRGDTLWSVTQRHAGVPVWLIQQYNPDLDLGQLRAGAQLVVPRIEDVVEPPT